MNALIFRYEFYLTTFLIQPIAYSAQKIKIMTANPFNLTNKPELHYLVHLIVWARFIFIFLILDLGRVLAPIFQALLLFSLLNYFLLGCCLRANTLKAMTEFYLTTFQEMVILRAHIDTSLVCLIFLRLNY